MMCSKLRVLFGVALFMVYVNALPIPSPEDQQQREETPEKTFQRSDVNKDKSLTFDEFLRSDSLYEQLKTEEFKRLDKNDDGVITDEEYRQHYKQEKESSDALKAEYFGHIFEEFDENFDLKINQDELEKVLAKRFQLKPKEDLNEIFKKFDVNNDGGLDLNEYMNLDANLPFTKFVPLDASDKSTTQSPSNQQNEDVVEAETPNTPILAFKTEKLPLMKNIFLAGKL